MPPGEPTGPTGDDRWVIVALGVAVAGAALVVVSGAVSGALWGGGWVWPHASALGPILRGVVADPAHPGSGWPSALARRIPDAAPYWATLAALAAMAGVALAWVVGLAGGRGTGAGRDGLARPSQLRRHASVAAARRRRPQTRPSLVRVRRPAPAELGYPLGRAVHGGVALWPSWEASLRLVGPPGEGKTFRVLARVLRQHPGPVLATSTKPDLYELSAGARSRVWALDPEGMAGGAAQVRWSPVAGCEQTEVAERRAAALLAAAGEATDSRHGAFFRDSARDVLKCYLHAAALDGRDIATVLEWSQRTDDPAPAEVLRRHPGAGPGWAGLLAVHTTGAPETTSGVMRHLARALACFGHARVLALCCPGPGEAFDVEALLDTSATVYLLGKGSALGTVAPLLTAFAQEVLDTAERVALTRPSRRLDPPLLALLDEAPSIAPVPTLPALVADGRGRGIVVVYAMQSLSQGGGRWGAQGAEPMANATTVTAVLGGLTSATDLGQLERLCGTHRVRRESEHRGGAGRSARSTTTSSEHEPVLRAADIRTLGDGVALVLWGRLPPVLAAQPMLSQDRGWGAIRTEEARLRRASDDARRGGAPAAGEGEA